MSDCFLRIVPRGAPQARPKNGISGYVVRSEGRGPGVGWGGGVFRGGWGPNVSIPGILGTGTLCIGVVPRSKMFEYGGDL